MNKNWVFASKFGQTKKFDRKFLSIKLQFYDKSKNVMTFKLKFWEVVSEKLKVNLVIKSKISSERKVWN